MKKDQFCYGSDAITAFTEGDCWALALSVNKLTGWPLVFLCDESGDGEHPAGYWMHVMVKHPKGKWLDAHGLNTPKQIRKYWYTNSVYVTEDRVEAMSIIDWDGAPMGLNFPEYSADEYAKDILERIAA